MKKLNPLWIILAVLVVVVIANTKYHFMGAVYDIEHTNTSVRVFNEQNGLLNMPTQPQDIESGDLFIMEYYIHEGGENLSMVSLKCGQELSDYPSITMDPIITLVDEHTLFVNASLIDVCYMSFEVPCNATYYGSAYYNEKNILKSSIFGLYFEPVGCPDIPPINTSCPTGMSYDPELQQCVSFGNDRDLCVGTGGTWKEMIACNPAAGSCPEPYCECPEVCPQGGVCTKLTWDATKGCVEDEMVCCKSYSLGANMVETNIKYEKVFASECSVPEGWVGGGKTVVDDIFCGQVPPKPNDYTGILIVGAVMVGLFFIYYFVFERGPKKGFFRGGLRK